MVETLTIINVGLLIANLAVLALTLKLYTEFAKDRFQSVRASGGPTPDSGKGTDRG